VIEMRTGPFTAARGRQTGLDALLTAHPSLQYVQFVDGDCELDQGWLPQATAALDSDQAIAAVCGRRRETRTTESRWSRLIDVDWNIPPGEVPYIGGDALCRIAALQRAGGWDISLIAGEEPDLSFRLRDAGFRIMRLPVEQTKHDIAMSRFWQFWRRAKRGGYASMQVGWRHRKGTGRRFAREAWSGVLYGLLLPIASITIGWLWWPLLLVPLLLYGRVVVSMVRYARRRGCRGRDAWAYAFLTLVGKAGAGVGGIKALFDLMRGRRSGLIEYKKVPTLTGAAG
jgi:cellulose synthase/poly-beta-1,6-N-acetylglucosamine synthase-like glycosyltransferase